MQFTGLKPLFGGVVEFQKQRVLLWFGQVSRT